MDGFYPRFSSGFWAGPRTCLFDKRCREFALHPEKGGTNLGNPSIIESETAGRSNEGATAERSTQAKERSNGHDCLERPPYLWLNFHADPHVRRGARRADQIPPERYCRTFTAP